MNIQEIKKLLPTKPSTTHIQNIADTDSESFEEIFTHYCLFKRVNIIANETPYTECFGFGEESPYGRYKAQCWCTACEDEFYAGYKSKSKRRSSYSRGIVFIEGEDGMQYEGACSPMDTNAVVYESGDRIYCPKCGESLVVREWETIKNDEYFALRTQEIATVGKYAAVITFELVHKVSSDGEETNDCKPISAVVIGENRELEIFIYDSDVWLYEGRFDKASCYFDGLQEIYIDYNSINDSKIGGVVDDDLPDLTGTTGEKAGLLEFIMYGGKNPAVYLAMWSTWPNIENLTKSLYGPALTRNINEVVNRNIEYEYFPTNLPDDFDWINYEETKPHRMLNISKEELRSFESHLLTIENTRFFYDLKEISPITLKEYVSLIRIFNAFQLVKLGRIIKNKNMKTLTINRVLNYLKKQKQYTKRGLELFIDYIDKGEIETEELIFPKSLEEAHDRMLAAKELKVTQKLQDDFLKVKRIYAGIEYSDGELCAVIPSAPQELESEGKILRHCVGRYVKEHSEGEQIIIFIRHSRRPERSYYTLQINFKGKTPKRIQLHGYGNERHGKNKEYSHSIPKKVKAFVEKYEKEILIPWSLERGRPEKTKKTE